MVRDLTGLDAHEQPAPGLKAIWKGFSRTEQADLLQSPAIDDVRDECQADNFRVAGIIPAENIVKAWEYIGYKAAEEPRDARILYHPLVPGLHIVPDLIPLPAQKIILDRVVHRDLSNPEHQTNLHLHYNVPYPQASDGSPGSFFGYKPDSGTRFLPKDPAVHKPLTIQQVLNRRLSWMTLGGQFDWTNRIYPGTVPPDFPQDIGGFLHAMFPQTIAQAAIVNFYRPGDTMMMHRDVSEKTDRGLISLSIGCDSLFMIAPNGVDWEVEEAKGSEQNYVDKKFVLLRIRSGDVVYMTEESRYAWHGVPKVIRGSCPEALQEWPAQAKQEDREGDEYEAWRGWMRNKRVNINVRQME
ncbi:hypothetical protein TD95_000417 [Thielaviopsis punctulata]|uniref:mRNA N(6)-methyladenine demethylase n=1 Tax=Thielaviopsis punctulata TaxID=72032 RepID=A0A0F4ZI24_9PEZI|nr:hypothetical protein TD95_000417 [Thielaviopsis punctulata]